MSWLSAMRIVLTSIISIASASGIIIAISKWLSEKIATHMSQKMLANNQHKLDKLLAEYQTALDRKAHISTIHFDTEFSIYQDLSSTFYEMISAVHWLFPAGLDRAPASGNWKEICNERYRTAQEKYNAAASMLGKKAPFIPKDKYDLFHKIQVLAAKQINTYAFSSPFEDTCDASTREIRNEGYNRTAEIDAEWEAILTQLREYFETLRNNKNA